MLKFVKPIKASAVFLAILLVFLLITAIKYLPDKDEAKESDHDSSKHLQMLKKKKALTIEVINTVQRLKREMAKRAELIDSVRDKLTDKFDAEMLYKLKELTEQFVPGLMKLDQVSKNMQTKKFVYKWVYYFGAIIKNFEGTLV